MKRTKHLSLSVIKDAMSACNSIYRHNAKSAVGYAFVKKVSGREVETGEYVFRGYEDLVTPERFDGIITFKDKKLKDLRTSEIIDLN